MTESADGLGSGEEIIENGTFDEGNAGNKWAPYGEGTTLGEGWSTFHNAARSLKVENRKTTSSGTVHDITGKVKAGDTYTIDGWATYRNGENQNPNPPAELGFNVSILYGTNETKEIMVTKKLKVNEWGNLVGDYTVPQNADTSRVLLLVETEYKENPTQDELVIFFIDDFSMKKVQSAEEGDADIVKAVMEKIAAIGKVVYTAQCKSKIDLARNAYNALTNAQKALVTNYNVLTAAENTYRLLKTQADNAANVVKKGDVYKVSGYSYKVTDVAKKTVTVTGITNKNSKKIKVNNTVKIKNATYKITAIGSSAFKNCKKATTATVGSNVKTIGANAFYGCKKLKSVKLNSKSLTNIGKKAFYKDGSLKTITIKSTKLKKVQSKAFYGINKKAKIKVPAKKLKAYKKLMKNKGQKKSVKITK